MAYAGDIDTAWCGHSGWVTAITATAPANQARPVTTIRGWRRQPTTAPAAASAPMCQRSFSEPATVMPLWVDWVSRWRPTAWLHIAPHASCIGTSTIAAATRPPKAVADSRRSHLPRAASTTSSGGTTARSSTLVSTPMATAAPASAAATVLQRILCARSATAAHATATTPSAVAGPSACSTTDWCTISGSTARAPAITTPATRSPSRHPATPPAATATAHHASITARAATMPPPSSTQGGSVTSRNAGGCEL